MARGQKKTFDRNFIATSVYDLAIERLNHAFDMFDHIAVSFSGGKDSTACLMLTLQVARERGRLPLDVVFWDEEAIPMQTEEYVRRVANWPDVNLTWYCLPVKHRNACSRKSPWWYPWAEEDRDKWVRPLPPEAVTTCPGFVRGMSIPDMNGLMYDPKMYGNVGFIMGIRAQESLVRLRAVTAKKEDNFIVKYTGDTDQGNFYKVYPIYDWRTEDVWTAPNLYGWDYNRAYDLLDKAGMTPSMQRVSPAYGEEPLQKLWSYSVCFPEVWDRMLSRVPGAATAARYALTELYSYGSRPEKPDDVTWEEYLTHYIRKFDPTSQKIIAERIKLEIRNHYRQTKDPILEQAPHPETGVSWKWLLMLAMRGDFKNRKQPGARILAERLPELWANYEEEYAQWREAKGLPAVSRPGLTTYNVEGG